MAVAFEMRFKGATLEQYDQVMALMGLAPKGPVVPNSLFHWAAATDDGLLVVDVWETAEAFNAFAAEQIGPFTQQVGVAGPPEITSYEVHNYLVTA
jgi:hypothetical protein